MVPLDDVMQGHFQLVASLAVGSIVVAVGDLSGESEGGNKKAKCQKKTFHGISV